MGRRGPPKTPTVTLVNRGSWRGQTRTGEPDMEGDAPPCPDWLTDKAKEVWAACAAHLTALGVVRPCDGETLARYCEYVVAWRGMDAQTRIDKTGREISMHLLRLEQQFGLTPSARAGLVKPTAANAKPKLEAYKLAT